MAQHEWTGAGWAGAVSCRKCGLFLPVASDPRAAGCTVWADDCDEGEQ